MLNKKLYKRPENLLYSADEKPRFFETISLALQYIGTASAFLILPVILAQQAKLSVQASTSFVSIAMIMVALSALLQIIKRGPIGSGKLAPATTNPAYLAASIMAINKGGTALLAGMTIFAGIIEALFGFLLKKMRKLFPPEIAALIIAMIGFDLGTIGITELVLGNTASPASNITAPYQIIFGLIILLIMFVLHQWGTKKIKIFSLLISIIIGYLIILFSGYFNETSAKIISQASWFFVPSIPTDGYKFDHKLIIPFIIAALVCALKVSGSLTALQKMQNENWKAPNMKNISKGTFADSTTTIISGLFGNMGLNMSSSCMALSVSMGIGSRIIAIPFAIIFVALAFCPKIALILLYMPSPVSASILIYLGTSLLINSFETLAPLINTTRRQYIIGIAFMFGLSYEIYPRVYGELPNLLQLFAVSALAVSAIVAIVLNFLLMLRIKR